MSQHKRNVLGMQNAIREKSELAVCRVQELINEMLKNNLTISFNNVAKQARVSKGWLYSQKSICEQIKELRMQNNETNFSVTQSSLIARDTVIATLKTRLKKMELENNELRKQIEIAYGELHNRR